VIAYVTFYTDVAWTWYTVIGATVTFATAWFGSVLFPRYASTDTTRGQ